MPPIGQGGIYGSVTSAGQPIVGATILVTDGDGNVHATTTDILGNYYVMPLAAGSYTVAAIAAGFETQHRTMSVVANQMSELNFVLVAESIPTAYRLLVTVTGANPANVIVNITDRDESLVRIGNTNTWEARSNTTFTNATVTASATGYETASATVGAHDEAGVAQVTLNLQSIGLPQGYGGVRGTVTDESDNPVANATIIIVDSRGEVHQVTTDAMGNYSRMPIPSGDITVTVARAGYYSDYDTGTVVAGQWTIVNFTLTSEENPTSYRLLTTVTGAPADDISVHITGEASLNRVGNSNVWEARTNEALTGETVTAGAAGFRNDSEVVGAHDEHGVALVSLNLERITPPTGQGGIYGFVTSAGQPIVGATILVTDSDGNVHATTTDILGNYHVMPLAVGSYTVAAIAAGFETQH
jgi:hypothetical protein